MSLISLKAASTGLRRLSRLLWYHRLTMETNLLAPADPVARLYDGKVYDSSERAALLDWFRFEDRRILDVGCGSGAYAGQLRKQGVEVHGVTLSPAEQEQAASKMERAVLANVETWTPDYPTGYFDAFLLSHILEHLVDPVQTLRRLSPILRPGGRVYVAVPNIAYWRYRLKAFLGKFDYEEVGPLDKRHLRFFTLTTAQKMLREAGLELLRVEARGHFPLGPLRRAIPALARVVDALALRFVPNLFGYEIHLCATRPVSS